MDTFRAVIFDFDDTLVASRAAKWLVHQTYAAERFGLEITDDDMRRIWGRPFQEILTELYGDLAKTEQLLEELVIVRSRFPLAAFDGAGEALHQLARAGITLGIITSSFGDLVRHEMRTAALPADIFGFIHGADECRSHKPDPAVFDNALELLSERGIDRSQTVYVGDMLLDHEAALGAGVSFVAVTTGVVSHEEFAGAGVEHILTSVSELPSLLML